MHTISPTPTARRWWTSVLLFGCVLGSAASAAHAQDPDEPAFDVGTSVDGEAYEACLDERGRTLRQSFVPTRSILSAVELDLVSLADAPRGSWGSTLMLRRLDRQGLPGDLIAAATAEHWGWAGETQSVMFAFEDEVLLVPETPYLLEWSADDALSLGWAYDGWNAYADGAGSGCAGQAKPGRDYGFATWTPPMDPGGAGGCNSSCSDGTLTERWFDMSTMTCEEWSTGCRFGCSEGGTACSAPFGPPPMAPDCGGDSDGDGVSDCDDLCPGSPTGTMWPVDATGCSGCRADEDGGDPMVAGGVYDLGQNWSAVVTPGNPGGGSEGNPEPKVSKFTAGLVGQDQCADADTLLEASCDLSEPCMLPGDADVLLGGHIPLWSSFSCVVGPTATAGTVSFEDVPCECGCADGACVPSPDTDSDGLADCVDPDVDGDGTDDVLDNCPDVANADQADSDGDGTGDACDPCPDEAFALDVDGDGLCPAEDLCDTVADPANNDSDGDGVGDACDTCPNADDLQDADGDGVPDNCDVCWMVADPAQGDVDGQGGGDACDCFDGFQGPNEAGVDCGGSCSSSCSVQVVSGVVQFVHDSNTNSTKPARNMRVSSPQLGGGTVITDDSGFFQLPVPVGQGGSSFTLRVHPNNGDADVARAWLGCDQHVRFTSASFTLPTTQDINVGLLEAGDLPTSNLDGTWFEPKSWCAFGCCACGPSWCTGTTTSDTISYVREGAGYFNAAETVRVARDYAEDNRAAQADDAIPAVELDLAPWTNGAHTSLYMHLDGQSGFFDPTIAHEYGHFLQIEIGTPNVSAAQLGDHFMCSSSQWQAEEFAFSEGFPHFFAGIVTNLFELNKNHPTLGLVGADRALAVRQVHTGEQVCTGLGVNQNIEGAVYGSIWDIVDAVSPSTSNPFDDSVTTETWDQLSIPHGVVFEVFDGELDAGLLGDAPDICDLARALRQRNPTGDPNVQQRLWDILSAWHVVPWTTFNNPQTMTDCLGGN